MKKNAKIRKEFHALPNDVERWQWVKANQDTGVVIYLDNDDTYGVLPGDEEVLQFDWFIGSYEGVLYLFEAMGINFEEV